MPPPVQGWCETSDTLLGTLASGMVAGEWVELPANDSLNALPLHEHLISWNDNGVWNPIARKVQWVGSPGACCADPSAYQLVSYDVATDTWDVAPTPWGDHIGHAYDGNAMDPASGTHYFARGADIRGFDGTDWWQLPDAPFDGPVAPAASWFTAANALVYVGYQDRVALYDGSSWTQVGGAATWGSYHMFAEYSPSAEVVWLGAGNGGEQRHARLDQDGTTTQLANAPFSLNTNSNAFKIYEPATGNFLVRNNQNYSWHEYDIVADSWADVTTAVRSGQPASWSQEDKMFITAVEACQLLMIVTHDDLDRHVYLYKHG